MLTFRSVAVRRSILVVYVALIVLLSLLPENDLPKVKLFPHADKLIHMGMYAGFAFLLVWNLSRGVSAGKRWIPFLLVFLLGTAMEILQYLGHYGRSFDVLDIVADVLGCFPGLWCWKVFGKWLLGNLNTGNRIDGV